jgi:hypothetical protein
MSAVYYVYTRHIETRGGGKRKTIYEEAGGVKEKRGEIRRGDIKRGNYKVKRNRENGKADG